MSSATTAIDAHRAQVLARAAVGTVRLAHEIDRELAETISLRQRGGKAGAPLVTGQRGRTDTIAQGYRKASDAAATAVPGLREPLRLANEALGQLESARASSLAQATSAAADKTFADITTALLEVADSVPSHITDPELANAARAVAMIAAMEHDLSLERAQIRAIFAKGALDPGDLGSVATLSGQRQEHYDQFNRAADNSARDKYQDIVQGDDVEQTIKMRHGVLDADRDKSGLEVDPDAWYTAASNTIRRINLVGLALSKWLDEASAQIADDAWRNAFGTALGTSGVAIGALVTAVMLAIRISRRLRRLREAALTVAKQELPDAILAVANGTSPVNPYAASTAEASDSQRSGASGGKRVASEPSAAAVTRSLAMASDEIGEVADAFATVHQSALRLAGQQAELRIDVARMAEILARRIRTLITRQLRLLDDFEREETDPDVLDRLFALDHLAARLRRNGENLLVLAGGEPGRAFSHAFPLGAVVTASASEIEEFARVEANLGDIMIAGPVVGDLVHLLAELLENATAFSPPNTSVRVDARRTIDGAVVRVHDSGIGIVPSRLEEINKRLAQPATLTSAAAGTMGLHVVAHLASRHGIRVQLHPTGTGTVAYVALPHQTISVQPAIAPAPRGVPMEIGAPGRPALVATRSSGPAGRASGPAQDDRVPAAAADRSGSRSVPAGIPAPRRPVTAPRPAPAGGNSLGQTPRDWFRPVPETSGQRMTDPPVGVPVAGGTPSGAPVTATFSISTSATRPLPVIRTMATAPGEIPEEPRGPMTGEETSAEMATPMVSAPSYLEEAYRQEVYNDMPPATGGPGQLGDFGDGGSRGCLPRRSPGAQLAPEASAPPAAPVADVTVDPEAVRARLSAFAEGVSAALRSTTLHS
jgi:signal transduction histidine kinase